MKTSNYIISLGSNTAHGDKTVEIAITAMKNIFRTVTYTRTLRNDAVGMGEEAPDFFNALVCVSTSLSETNVVALCKALERQTGNTRIMREKGITVLDADVVMADDAIIRQKDYDREYFQTLLAELEINRD